MARRERPVARETCEMERPPRALRLRRRDKTTEPFVQERFERRKTLGYF